MEIFTKERRDIGITSEIDNPLFPREYQQEIVMSFHTGLSQLIVWLTKYPIAYHSTLEIKQLCQRSVIYRETSKKYALCVMKYTNT